MKANVSPLSTLHRMITIKRRSPTKHKESRQVSPEPLQPVAMGYLTFVKGRRLYPSTQSLQSF